MISELKGKNLYAILGISSDADKNTIKSAFRNLAKKYHPDTNKGDKLSEMKFKEINFAYEILSDTQKRKEYDEINGFNQIKQSKSAYSNPHQAKNVYSKQTTTPPEKEQKITPKNNNSSVNTPFSESFVKFVNEVFTSMDKQPIKGKDLNINITISMQEAFRGTTRQINIRHSECCPVCHGRKFLNDVKCKLCNGKGEIFSERTISVKIPPHTKSGDKIRIKNEGNSGQNGGENGNLYLYITVEKNSIFRFDNIDVLSDVQISPTEAALGTTVNIPTINGNVSMKIPAETSSGQKFKLHGLGVFDKQNNIRGNHIVTVFIKMPKNLSKQEKELYQKLSELRNFNPRNEE